MTELDVKGQNYKVFMQRTYCCEDMAFLMALLYFTIFIADECRNIEMTMVSFLTLEVTEATCIISPVETSMQVLCCNSPA